MARLRLARGSSGDTHRNPAHQARQALWRGPEENAAIYDGSGNIVDRLQMRLPLGVAANDRSAAYYGTRADVWGDSRDEVIFFGPRGACIWANARPLALPTHYNNTLYPGM